MLLHNAGEVSGLGRKYVAASIIFQEAGPSLGHASSS